MFTWECYCVYFFHCAPKYHKLSVLKQHTHLPLLRVRSRGVVQLESLLRVLEDRTHSVYWDLDPIRSKRCSSKPMWALENSVTCSRRSEVAALLQVLASGCPEQEEAALPSLPCGFFHKVAAFSFKAETREPLSYFRILRLLFISANEFIQNRGLQAPSPRPIPVHGLVGTGPHTRR